jgi:hypothetical protein
MKGPYAPPAVARDGADLLAGLELEDVLAAAAPAPAGHRAVLADQLDGVDPVARPDAHLARAGALVGEPLAAELSGRSKARLRLDGAGEDPNGNGSGGEPFHQSAPLGGGRSARRR